MEPLDLLDHPSGICKVTSKRFPLDVSIESSQPHMKHAQSPSLQNLDSEGIICRSLVSGVVKKKKKKNRSGAATMSAK